MSVNKKRKRQRDKKRRQKKKALLNGLTNNEVQKVVIPKLIEDINKNSSVVREKNSKLMKHISKKQKLHNGNIAVNNTEVRKFPSKKAVASEDAILNGSSSSSNNTINRDALLLQRRQLPIFGVRRALLKELKENKSTIVMGETGSGKTTQIPQYLFEKGLHRNGIICITQPRRVAAISIAKRVAEEMDTGIGGLVGYSVRFEESVSSNTKIKFVTDGMLLREAILDPLLLKYSWILLDEAHERSLNTDILFSIVKKAQRQRAARNNNPIQIVIMSATMDVNHLSCYFDNACTVTIEGRQHPISIFHSKIENNDYVMACMSTVFQVHKEAPPREDILIFLTGQEEIDNVVHALRLTAKDPSLKDFPHMKIYPFYAALPFNKEQCIFEPTGSNERKVIVSTNVAETSITIPGIKYVIDSGRVKARTFNANSGFELLKVQKISKAQAWQRSGRSGREGPGVCYRTYTLNEYSNFRTTAIPDILQSNLSNVILQLLAIGLKNIKKFDFIDKPSVENINEAELTLQHLGAVKIDNGICLLTELGRKMASFPLDPRFSKILLSSSNFGCSEEILSIISILSSESVFLNPSQKRKEALEVQQKFSSGEGDHITLLKVFKAFKASKQNKLWCQKNFLSYRNLCYASEVRNQLAELCRRNNIPLESSGHESEPVIRSLVSGLFMNVAELQHGGKFISIHNRKEVYIHPSSTLFRTEPMCILYTELVKTGKLYMRINSSVNSSWLLEAHSEYFQTRHFSVNQKGQ